MYSAETASETLAGAPSAGIKTTRDGSSSASGKVGGAGGGESARGARAEGRRRGRDRRSARTVVMSSSSSSAAAAMFSSWSVAASASADPARAMRCRETIWAARASSRAMDSAAARSNAASAAASSRSRAARGTAASGTGSTRARDAVGAASAAEASVKKTGISASLDPSLSSSLASMVGIASLVRRKSASRSRRMESRTTEKPEGGSVGSAPIFAGATGGVKCVRLTFPLVSHVGTSRQENWRHSPRPAAFAAVRTRETFRPLAAYLVSYLCMIHHLPPAK